jgi:hypothetical protein
LGALSVTAKSEELSVTELTSTWLSSARLFPDDGPKVKVKLSSARIVAVDAVLPFVTVTKKLDRSPVGKSLGVTLITGVMAVFVCAATTTGSAMSKLMRIAVSLRMQLLLLVLSAEC